MKFQVRHTSHARHKGLRFRAFSILRFYYSYFSLHSGVAELRVGPELGGNDELGETPTRQLRNNV